MPFGGSSAMLLGMAKRRKAQTLLEVCVARAGGGWREIPKGMRVWQFIVQWTVLSQLEDRPVALMEYADFWDEPDRTAYRHLKEFRELFGDGAEGFRDPQPIADRLKETVPAFHPSKVEGLRAARAERKRTLKDRAISDLIDVHVAL
jgi:hypothetical protein